MITHIVTLVKEASLGERTIITDQGREVAVQCHQRSPFDPVVNYNHKNFLDLGSFLFESDVDARRFAEFAVKEKPGYNVYISEAKSILTVEIGDPIAKTITAKGVMPE